jgi:hypothetical protein
MLRRVVLTKATRRQIPGDGNLHSHDPRTLGDAVPHS